MEYRTDLALEYTEPASQRVEKKKNCTITRIRENGAEYITLEVPAISDHIDSGDELLHQLRDELRALLPEKGLVLVAGLGNRAITPDALGPQTNRRTGSCNATHPGRDCTGHGAGRLAPRRSGQHRGVGLYRSRNPRASIRVGPRISACRCDRSRCIGSAQLRPPGMYHAAQYQWHLPRLRSQ